MSTLSLANLADNVAGLTLSSAYTAGTSSTFTLGSGGSLLPAVPFRITVVTAGTYGTTSETLTIYEVTNVVSNTLTVGVSSPIEGTTDRNYAIGDKVDLRVTANSINDLNTAVAPVVVTGISAAGTTQGTATALAAPTYFGSPSTQVVGTVGAGSGVALPAAVAGMRITVVNGDGNPLLVYPASGATINGGSANAPVTIAPGIGWIFTAASTTTWYYAGTGLPSVTAYPTAGTFTYPISLDATTLSFTVFSGGAGGGGGGVYSGTSVSGGSGGSGSSATITPPMRAADVIAWNSASTSLSVTVGAGGTGGGSGATGNYGNSSYVGGTSAGTALVYATGGIHGFGGATSAAGGASGAAGMWASGNSGGTTVGGVGSTPTAANGPAGGGGGGGGGVNSTGPTGYVGAAGGSANGIAFAATGGTAGTVGGGTGGTGGSLALSDGYSGFGGLGGGGGGGNASGTGGTGGTGGFPGGGGGGGGAGTTGGPGGAGGGGLVLIYAS